MSELYYTLQNRDYLHGKGGIVNLSTLATVSYFPTHIRAHHCIYYLLYKRHARKKKITKLIPMMNVPLAII